MSTDAVARQAEQLAREKGWVARRTAGDQAFAALKCTHRDYAYVGRRFIAWTVKDGEPRISAVFRTTDFDLTARGLAIIFKVAIPGYRGEGVFRVEAQPTKVPGFDFFLWIPAFCDVHYVPFNYDDPASQWRVSLSLVAKTASRPDLPPEEGKTYFASKADFNKYWPEHALP